jgi:hypothetical protein
MQQNPQIDCIPSSFSQRSALSGCYVNQINSKSACTEPPEHTQSLKTLKKIATPSYLRHGAARRRHRWIGQLGGTASGGAAVFCEASDELRMPHWRELLPEQLLDDWVRRGLYFNSVQRRGCIPHRLGALSEHGLLGGTVRRRSRREASELMRQMRCGPRQP